MTFEASRSKQLLVLQPKGKALYNDKSSFGFKMLEQMGWKGEGHGLGRNQQGDKDFIQVRYRSKDATGLGFDKLKDNQWTENENNFNELLQSLNSNNNNDEIQQTKKEKKSLEEASKSSRARVHYKKFTRGKDVLKYSEKDLANILGKKTLKESETKAEEKKEESEEEFVDPMKSSMIINTGISMYDYFKKKRNNGEMAEGKEEEEEGSKGEKKRLDSESNEAEEAITEIPKKKKKKRKESNLAEIQEEVVKKKQKEDPEMPAETTKNKKKKKKTTAEEVSPVNNSTPPINTDRGFNTMYGTETIKVTSHVAQKMSSMTIHNFTSANLGNIVGYGMTEDIEIKVIQSKIGDDSVNTDKYSIYNMDRVLRVKQNPRKILTKIKRTQKSIQML